LDKVFEPGIPEVFSPAVVKMQIQEVSQPPFRRAYCVIAINPDSGIRPFRTPSTPDWTQVVDTNADLRGRKKNSH
jgi:hypothetical protein